MTSNYLRFWGVRGSYPAPFETHLRAGGNTSCVEIRVGDHLLVCDAGSGVIPLGNLLMGQSRIRDLLVILTHYHWDHISGLPFFVPAFTQDWSLEFFGPGKNPIEIEESLAEQMRAPYFPVETETWLADIRYRRVKNGTFSHGPIQIQTFNVHHPGTTFGYRIQAAGKTIVYVSDNELLFLDHSINQRLDRRDMDEQEQALLREMKEEEKWTALKFMMDADILIHDAQYSPEDYQKKRGWGHSCYIDTVNCAIDARVKSLYLYHLDPNYPDAVVDDLHRRSLKIIHHRKSSLRCYVAREGHVVDLDR